MLDEEYTILLGAGLGATALLVIVGCCGHFNKIRSKVSSTHAVLVHTALIYSGRQIDTLHLPGCRERTERVWA